MINFLKYFFPKFYEKKHDSKEKNGKDVKKRTRRGPKMLRPKGYHVLVKMEELKEMSDGGLTASEIWVSGLPIKTAGIT